jgi:DNA-binding CsgD family transcriptional regulator/pimeloyl-ACP methyl ester carboxylesterase
VKYIHTSDGVRIAVSAEGTGAPVVLMPLVPWTTLGMPGELVGLLSPRQWGGPRRDRQTIQYDVRGSGLSEGARDLSLEAQLLDLGAAIESVPAEPVALIASAHSSPAAIAYAAQHPDRLSHLVLWNGFARAVDFLDQTRVRAVQRILHDDWELFTSTLAMQMLGWEEPAAAAHLAALIRGSIRRQDAEEALETLRALDVTSMLPDVRAPTLVLGRLGPDMPPDAARSLVAEIPFARLALAHGSAIAPALGDSKAVQDAIDSFVSERPQRPQDGGGALGPAEGRAGPALAPPTKALTRRELEVLTLVKEGMSNEEIASRLFVAVTTVKKHLRNASVKLNAKNRTHAVTRAGELGLFTASPAGT